MGRFSDLFPEWFRYLFDIIFALYFHFIFVVSVRQFNYGKPRQGCGSPCSVSSTGSSTYRDDMKKVGSQQPHGHRQNL
jgi:hypothetical protein